MWRSTCALCASPGYTRCFDRASVCFCASPLQNLTVSQDFYSPLSISLEWSSWPRIWWCGIGGFQEQVQCLFVGLVALSFFVFNYFFCLQLLYCKNNIAKSNWTIQTICLTFTYLFLRPLVWHLPTNSLDHLFDVYLYLPILWTICLTCTYLYLGPFVWRVPTYTWGHWDPLFDIHLPILDILLCSRSLEFLILWSRLETTEPFLVTKAPDLRRMFMFKPEDPAEFRLSLLPFIDICGEKRALSSHIIYYTNWVNFNKCSFVYIMIVVAKNSSHLVSLIQIASTLLLNLV